MSDTKTQDAKQPAASGSHAGHELSDARIGPILQFGAVLAVFCAMVLGAMWLLFGYFERREQVLKQSEFPLAVGTRGEKPPAPRLEGIDLEYAKRRARLDAPQPASLTPVQELAVDSAMKRVREQLPVRSNGPKPEVQPPRDSNSGRGRVEEGP